MSCKLPCKGHRILPYVRLGTYVKMRIRTWRILASQVCKYVIKKYEAIWLGKSLITNPLVISRWLVSYVMRSLETIRDILILFGLWWSNTQPPHSRYFLCCSDSWISLTPPLHKTYSIKQTTFSSHYSFNWLLTSVQPYAMGTVPYSLIKYT